MQLTQFGTTLANSIEQYNGNAGGAVCTTILCSAIFAVIMALNALVVIVFSVKLFWMWEQAIARKVGQLLYNSGNEAVRSTAHIT